MMPMLSVNGINKFISEANGANRIERLKKIADNQVVQQSLNVCLYKEKCNRCSKCMRIILGLKALNKLDSFKSVFGMDFFEKNYSRLVAENLADKHEQPYNKEILNKFKENEIQYPLKAKILSIIFIKPKNFVREISNHNVWLNDMYYRLFGLSK